MASKTCASPSSPLGRSLSMVRSVDWASNARAASNSRYDDSCILGQLVEVGRLAADRTVGREDDLLHLHLGLGKLLLAVPLQQRTALVGRDRFVELDLAALELLDDALQLLQRILEGQAGNILRQCGFFRQFRLSGGAGGW